MASATGRAYKDFSLKLICKEFQFSKSHNMRSKVSCCPFTFNELVITVWFLCLRLQQHSIERVMDLTDSFTWEDLPTRDAHTGHLTAAGWIPLIMKYSRSAAVAMLSIHFAQSTIRIVTNHETVLTAWYPFDWTVSPFYELVNISQVTIYKTIFSSISFYGILNLTDLVSWHISFSYLSFVLSSSLPYFSTMISNYRALVGFLKRVIRKTKNKTIFV